jgi:hypothetical protein
MVSHHQAPCQRAGRLDLLRIVEPVALVVGVGAAAEHLVGAREEPAVVSSRDAHQADDVGALEDPLELPALPGLEVAAAPDRDGLILPVEGGKMDLRRRRFNVAVVQAE